jgi:Helix-turn-helix.
LSVKYENNDQLLNELRYTIRKSGKTQREIADNLNIKPQGLNKILNKKNFSFEDMQNILSAIGYELYIEFLPLNTELIPPEPPQSTADTNRVNELLQQFNKLDSVEKIRNERKQAEEQQSTKRETLDEKLARLRKEHS